MAKCIRPRKPKEVHLDDTSFLTEDVGQGESFLKQLLETRLADLSKDIANHCIMVKASALSEFNIDCGQVQDGLGSRLERLLNEASTVIGLISRSNLISSTKHRYFIMFSYGLIEELEHLAQTVGRLADVDQTLYMEEHRNSPISNESIVLHSLASTWMAMIELLDTFCRLAPEVFNPNPDEPNDYDFLDQLEFSTARNNFAKALLMDFLITSWIKFNRLVKYDDLVKGLPFMCQCQMQTFFNLISLLTSTNTNPDKTQNEDSPVENVLGDMLQCILEYNCKPRLMTMSLKRFGIIPHEPCYALASRSELAYFVVWHLYSMARIARDATFRQVVFKCQTLFDDCSKLAKNSFDKIMSPHQKERSQLLDYMIKSWEAFIFQNSSSSQCQQ